jgi:outer membrane protein OmpA-like peptidoglycan-associated protein
MQAPRLVRFLAVGLLVALPRVTLAQGDFPDDFDADFGGSQTPPPSGDAAGTTPSPTPSPSPSPSPSPTPSPTVENERFGERGTESDAESESDAEPATESEPEAEPATEPATEAETELQRRLFLGQSSFYGPIGGIHVVDAGGGAVGTFRLALMTDFFIINDYIEAHDHQEHIGGALSVSWTPHRMVEAYAAFRSYANSNSEADPVLLQVLGDAFLGVKVFGRVTPIFTVGGDATLGILNTVGDIGVVLRSTSAGARFNFTTDLRGLPTSIPFVFRFGAQYWFDNSSNLVRDVEDARYQSLSDPAPRADEVRNLVTPAERFGLMINRTDFLNIGLGFEAPLEPRPNFLVSPVLEWRWAVPVNRQRFDCLLVPATPGSSEPAPGEEGCLDTQKLSAFPMTLTAGLRLSPVRGLGITAGVDIGITGVRTIVRELAPTAPYAVILGASYGYDPTLPAAPAWEAPETPAEEPGPLYTHGRVHGVVVAAADDRGEGAGTPIGGAVVAFAGRDLNSLIAGEDGRFVTYRFPAGEEITFDVSHPDYQPGQCVATIPEAPLATPEDAPTPATAPPTPGAPGTTELPPAPEPAVAPETAPAPGVPPPSPSDDPFFGKQDDANAPPAADEAETTEITETTETADSTETPAPSEASLDDAGDLIVEIRCELLPVPRTATLLGRVVDDDGAPVANATVQITGPQEHTVTSDAEGHVRIESIEPGEYTARIEVEGYLLKLHPFTVEPRVEATPQFTLIERPRRSLVRVVARRIIIRRQVNFATNSAEILPTSDPLLYEVAEAFMRNQDIRLVEIQGHTDDRGGAAHNMRLSQERAESVRAWLITHGVEAERIEARGYGSSQPIVPNITASNRARNRRVQFVIKDRD